MTLSVWFRFYCLLFLCASLISGTISIENGISASRLTHDMIEKTKDIETLSYTMKKIERIDGKMVTQISQVRLVRNPYKVYTKQIHPKKGLEVLYVDGKNNNKAIINPNKFPWVNLRLDPFGKIMRKDQHHTILDSGYDLVISIIEHIKNKYGEGTDTMLTYKGEKHWSGQACSVIEFANPNFKFIPYTVKKNETLLTIAKKFKLSEYMILKNNKKIHHYGDVSAGQIISIPNDYCTQMVVLIDQHRGIPLSFKIYDKKGLFEQYEFTNIEVDFKIDQGEFTESYAGYDF